MSEGGVLTFDQYTQNEIHNLNSEMEKVKNSQGEEPDERLVRILSLDKYVTYTSFMAALLFKILYIDDTHSEEKISKAKHLCIRIHKLIEM
jgi:hypothetical protein